MRNGLRWRLGLCGAMVVSAACNGGLLHRSVGGPGAGARGLPLVKPPYKRVTAFDLNTGDEVWMSPHGDGPRNHPALRELNLPALGGHSGLHGGGPLVTRTLLIVNSGARYVADQAASARAVTAYHKDNGEYLGSVTCPRCRTAIRSPTCTRAGSTSQWRPAAGAATPRRN